MKSVFLRIHQTLLRIRQSRSLEISGPLSIVRRRTLPDDEITHCVRRPALKAIGKIETSALSQSRSRRNLKVTPT